MIRSYYYLIVNKNHRNRHKKKTHREGVFSFLCCAALPFIKSVKELIINMRVTESGLAQFFYSVHIPSKTLKYLFTLALHHGI